MKTLQNIAVLISFLFVVSVSAQTYNAATTTVAGFQKKASEMDFLSSQNNQNSSRNTAATNSSVFINQIGAGNTALVNTKSDASEINVIQNGSGNDLSYSVSAETVEASILQNGDNNSIYHSNPFDIKLHEAQIIQNGNNQNVEWFGGNSFSEKMKIKMQGQNQTVIVRSFN